MSLRHSWKGFLKLSLVTIPVKAFPTAVSGGDVHLNQLHAACHHRIQHRKTCPVHGEVTSDDIVSGYDYAKGQYVVIDTGELDKLRTEADKSIQIDAFIAAGALDPLYANGKTHYLVPDGSVAHKAYAVLCQGMRQEKRHAVAQVVMHGKEQLVWLRPLDGLILMTQLHYAAQITPPSELSSQLPQGDIAPEEMDLLRILIDASTPKQFDFAKYRDEYTRKLSQLIDAKVAGQEIVVAPAGERMQVLNLMEALKESVAQTQKRASDFPKSPVTQAKDSAAPANGTAPRIRKKKTAVL